MVHVEVADSLLRIRAHYDDRHACAAIPGAKWVPSIKRWEYLLTPATASCAAQTFGQKLSTEDQAKLRDLWARLLNIPEIKQNPAGLEQPQTQFPCWEHQVVCYNMARELFGFASGSEAGGGVMFALDMGLGKTKCAVDVIVNHPDQIRSVLVTCPSSVIDVWTGNQDRIGQFEIHALPEQYARLHIFPVKGKNMDTYKKTKLAENARRIAEMHNKTFIAVVNYETAWREPFATWARDVKFDMIIADECHRLKSPGGKASKFFSLLGRSVKYRLGLSGTPMSHTPLDIYAQYRFLDPGIFGTSYSRFRSEFAVMGGFQGKQVLTFKNLDTLNQKFYMIAHRVMSKDVMDLPEFQVIERTCELEGKELKVYQQMNDEFCAEVEGNLVTAANALVKLLRLQEITSGFLDGQQVGSSKAKLLADVLEDFDLHEPVVIMAHFTNDLKMIRQVCEAQGRTYAELSGHANQLSQWQIGKFDVLGVQIKSGREGVDLTRARYTIYYSMGFSLGDYEQSMKRTDRPGQTREGLFIHLLAEGSVDLKVMKSLQHHKEVITAVLDMYKEEIDK
jgi:SNF2 family DNA or RNA helicase